MFLFLFFLSMFHVNIAHNWLFSPSRANKASTVIPAPAKTSERNPHYQVGAGQEFGVEWATGHPGSYYYFVVLKATDVHRLSDHTEPMLNDYLANAPESAFLYDGERFQRMHVSCTHQYYNGNPNRDCPSTGWNPGSSEQYEREITPEDSFYFDREEAWGSTPSDMTHFKYRSDKLDFDVRASYENSDYPWIEAVHKFRVTYRYPREWDIARFSLPARQGSGEYMIHMLWRGYRDVIDIDVLPEPANDVYGVPGGVNEWRKTDHCIYPNYSKHSNTKCHYLQADEENNIAECQQYCETRGRKCNALNVVPLFTPSVVKIAGQTPAPAVPWNNRCRQDRLPDNVDENTMVCYTFEAQSPTYDGFNPETEDIWVIRDNDPLDPVFYSSCYRRAVKRAFAGNVECPLCEETPVATEAKWDINNRCLSCEDASAPHDSSTVKLWHTKDVCEKCF